MQGMYPNHHLSTSRQHSSNLLAANSFDTLYMSPEGTWAARYNTWLLIKLPPKGVVFSFLFSPEGIQMFNRLSNM